MVEDTGKAPRTGTLKRVNEPEPLSIIEGAGGLPEALENRGRRRIAAIEDSWRIDDEWWRSSPVSRIYYAVTLSTGQRLVIYKDLIKNCWYRQEY